MEQPPSSTDLTENDNRSTAEIFAQWGYENSDLARLVDTLREKTADLIAADGKDYSIAQALGSTSRQIRICVGHPETPHWRAEEFVLQCIEDAAQAIDPSDEKLEGAQHNLMRRAEMDRETLMTGA